MTPEITPPLCEACQTPLKLIPAGTSKRTFKDYEAFYACPNNRECGGKTQKYVPLKPKTTPDSPQQVADNINKDVKTINALKIVRENLDSVIKFLEK